MEVLDQICYDAVVAAWVKAEYSSTETQFSEAFNGGDVPASWATSPDIDDPEQNQVRAGVLSLLRPMVDGLPNDVIWHRGRVDRDEFADFLYMAGDDWEALSGGTRRIGDGARLFTSSCQDLGLKAAVHRIRRQVLAGRVFPPLIAVSTPDLHRVVILEGHKRATAYLFGRKSVVEDVSFMVGLSPAMDQFAYW